MDSTSTLLSRSSSRDQWSFGLSELGNIYEAYSLGWMFCGMVILAGMTVANMSRRLLHYLILLEVSESYPLQTWRQAPAESFSIS